MKYREFGKCGFEASILGFGCMRLPFIGDESRIDEPEAIRMVRYAIDQGVNYIDTAYPYHGGMSEPFVAKALKDGYREKVKLATKLPTWLLKGPEDFDRYLDEQLKKLETDHIDLYLLHALDKGRWETLLKFGFQKALENYKKSGKVKYVGFSFHDDLDTFKKTVDAYDWDFCQIQYNYMNEELQAGTEGLRYAAAKGLGIVVMEPILGGSLAKKPPEEVERLWNSADVKRTPAEWALEWVWNHPEVSVVLSGMSTMEQVVENVRSAETTAPLTDKELSIVEKVRDTYLRLVKANCTGCRYCMPCPFGVEIPTNFTLYNEASMYNNVEGKKQDYTRMSKENRAASACQECGNCEAVCPQHLSIRKLLKEADVLFSA
jgi:predicted aldo/keto reductase-like oxidoreductase